MKSNRKSTVRYALLTASIVVALAAVAIVGVYLWLSPYRDYPYIYPNVSYYGISLGGMTRAEAEKAIEDGMNGRTFELPVQFPDGTQYILSPRQQVQPADMDAVLDAAFRYGRTGGSALNVYRSVSAAKNTSYEIPADHVIEYDERNLREQVDQIVQQVTTEPEDSVGTGDEEAKTVTVTPGQPGHTADADAIYAAACQAYDTGNMSVLNADYQDVSIDLTQLTALASTLHSRYTFSPKESVITLDQDAHAILVTKGTPGYDFDQLDLIDAVVTSVEAGSYRDVTVSLQELLPAAIDVSQACQSMLQEPTPVEYHDGGLTGGDVGYTLDMEEAQQTVDALDWGESCTLTLTEVQPDRTVEEVQELLFRDVLGECNTYHTYDSNRTTNLKLACREIDGIIMNPGRVFSFNTFVGERTEEKGYRKAIVYVNGDEEADDGGGVCQVVSTLYNAALYADLEITDRAAHQFLVTYVPGGLDATVYWGVQDFCFRNNTDYPIQIHAAVEDGQVKISITGTNETGKFVELDSSRSSSDSESISYEAYQYVYSGDGSLIEKRDLGVSTYAREY